MVDNPTREYNVSTKHKDSNDKIDELFWVLVWTYIQIWWG